MTGFSDFREKKKNIVNSKKSDTLRHLTRKNRSNRNENQRLHTRTKGQNDMTMLADMIKGNDPQLLQKLQAVTGWPRAKVRRFLRKCDEAKASERDEMIRAIEARS